MIKCLFSMTLTILVLCPVPCGWAEDRVMEISIDEISRAFDEDQQAAERKFRGKTLRIHGGIATSLRIDSLNHYLPTLTLQPDSGGNSPICQPRSISNLFSRHQYNDIVDAVQKMIRGESVTQASGKGPASKAWGPLNQALATVCGQPANSHESLSSDRSPVGGFDSAWW